MLKFLSIRDFVIVSALELDFSPGFTVLTGETGAGKSILIDALTLTLGGRGDAGMVRSGCGRADISAEFDIAALPQLAAWLHQQDLVGDADVCLLRRVLEANGRSRGFINGRSATLQQLRDAGEQLLDIHGQHVHQSLLRPDTQRVLLDGYAGIVAGAEQVAVLYRDWQSLRRNRLSLSANIVAVAAERELLQFQCNELRDLDFSIASWEETQAEHTRLAHVASLLETAALGVEVMSESEAACLRQLNTFSVRLREGVEHDAGLGEVLRIVESAQAELQEAVYALRRYRQRLDDDPQRLHELEQRMREVTDAARKYRVAPEQLDEVRQRLHVRLEELGGTADLADLQRREQVAQQHYLAAAGNLSLSRQQAADKLSREIGKAMQQLAMQGGRFSVVLQSLAEGTAFGLESIDFQVAANPGTPLRSLAKVASGGELSRISLAIQVATSQLASVPTLIFDEVDSGIGGGVAEIVGHLLKQLGKSCQVLCVTHLPQVAAAADHQWQVSKAVEQGVTLSHIAALDGESRIAEIARMLGGVKITETTRKHAAEMLSKR